MTISCTRLRMTRTRSASEAARRTPSLALRLLLRTARHESFAPQSRARMEAATGTPLPDGRGPGTSHIRPRGLVTKVPFPTASSIIRAQSDDVVAQKGRLCARREFFIELDASQNRIEIYSDFWSIFRARAASQKVIGLRDASVGAARRSSARGKSSAIARGLKNYAQKLNERTLMRCRAGLQTFRMARRAG